MMRRGIRDKVSNKKEVKERKLKSFLYFYFYFDALCIIVINVKRFLKKEKKYNLLLTPVSLYSFRYINLDSL